MSSLDNAQKEARQFGNDVFKMKKSYEEAVDGLENKKRENKQLQDEIADLTDFLASVGHSATKFRNFAIRQKTIRQKDIPQRTSAKNIRKLGNRKQFIRKPSNWQLAFGKN